MHMINSKIDASMKITDKDLRTWHVTKKYRGNWVACVANINAGGYGLGWKCLVGISGVAKRAFRGFDPPPPPRNFYILDVYMCTHIPKHEHT